MTHGEESRLSLLWIGNHAWIRPLQRDSLFLITRPPTFFEQHFLYSLLIIWYLLVIIEAIEASEYCEFLLRMLENTLLGNGRQNVTIQAPNIVWWYGKEFARLDNE